MDELRVIVLNWNYGGIDPDGNRDRWHALVTFLHEQEPDILLCQEIQAARPSGLSRHIRDTARALGMRAEAAGPPAPGAASGSEHHTAILVRSNSGLDVLETGPPAAYRPWDHVPWAEALIQVPGLPYLVRFYSVHLPHSSDVWQQKYAGKLASRIAVRAEHSEEVMAAGDWNCLAPADRYTQEQLAAMPARVRPARIRLLEDGTFQPIHEVHQKLAAVGLADVAAMLPPARREPRDLTPTGAAGGRIDRAYATSAVAAAVTGCRQVSTGATDHDLLIFTLNTGSRDG